MHARGALVATLMFGAAALSVGAAGADSGKRQPAVGWLAFTSERDAAVADIALITLDGRQRINLTRGRTPNQIGPSWSPDGRRLAFYGGRLPTISLYTIRADGSGLRRLLGAQSSFGIRPAYSSKWSAPSRCERCAMVRS